MWPTNWCEWCQVDQPGCTIICRTWAHVCRRGGRRGVCRHSWCVVAGCGLLGPSSWVLCTGQMHACGAGSSCRCTPSSKGAPTWVVLLLFPALCRGGVHLRGGASRTECAHVRTLNQVCNGTEGHRYQLRSRGMRDCLAKVASKIEPSMATGQVAIATPALAPLRHELFGAACSGCGMGSSAAAIPAPLGTPGVRRRG
jgi:hypothetical protein